MASSKWYRGSYASGFTAKLRAGPCSTPWSTGKITSRPVPASVPAVNRRARFVSVPGLSLPYQDRISLTRSLMRCALLTALRVDVGHQGSSIPRRAGPVATSLAALLDELGDEPRPARLVAGADAGALIAVKILVEEEKVAPVWIDLERPDGAVHGAPAVAAAQEQADEPARQLARDVPEVEQAVRAGRALDLEVVAVEVVELLQRLDQQVVQREPHGAAPVRVAPEERRAGFRGLVVHAMLHAVHRQHVRMLAMIARERADPVG